MAVKFDLTVEKVPCSRTTGRYSEVHDGSFTPSRYTDLKLTSGPVGVAIDCVDDDVGAWVVVGRVDGEVVVGLDAEVVRVGCADDTEELDPMVGGGAGEVSGAVIDAPCVVVARVTAAMG